MQTPASKEVGVFLFLSSPLPPSKGGGLELTGIPHIDNTNTLLSRFYANT